MINREFYLSYPFDLIVKILNVIKKMETREEICQWTRTRCNVFSSTAYGPYQITGEVIADVLSRCGYTLVTYQLLSYTRLFLAQDELFRKHGNKERHDFYNIDYDYGGKGHLYEEQYHEDYEELARLTLAIKMQEINYIIGDDISQVFLTWYGGIQWKEKIKQCMKVWNES